MGSTVGTNMFLVEFKEFNKVVLSDTGMLEENINDESLFWTVKRVGHHLYQLPHIRRYL